MTLINPKMDKDTQMEVTRIASEILHIFYENDTPINISTLALINALCIIFAAKHYEFKDDKDINFDHGLKLLLHTIETEMPRIYEEYTNIQNDKDTGDKDELGSILK